MFVPCGVDCRCVLIIKEVLFIPYFGKVCGFDIFATWWKAHETTT